LTASSFSTEWVSSSTSLAAVHAGLVSKLRLRFPPACQTNVEVE
jgi:hypothetical protein